MPSATSTMPGDHREVEVGVGVAGQLVLLAPRRARPAAAPATSATTSKYSHHSAAASAMPEHRRRDDARGRRRASAPDADRDDRLAEGDDDDQAVALGEVARDELPALGAEEERPAHVEQQRERPTARPAPAPSSSDAATSRPTPIAVLRRGRSTELAQLRVVAAGEHEQRDVRGAHDAVGERELSAEVAERLGDAERDDQQRGHRARTSRSGPRPPRGRRRW